MQTSNFSETDDRDAFLIADLIRQSKCCGPIQHTVVSRHLKEQLRMLQHSEDALIIWRRQLLTILQRVMPEVHEGVKEAQTDRILQFFNELPMADVSEAQWVSERLARGRSRAKLTALYRLVTSATSSIPDPHQWHKTWQLAWNGWASAQAQTMYSKQLIDSSVASHPITPLLLSVPGVNSMTIAAFFAGTGDLSQFTYARQVEKTIGFDLHRWQSGKMDARPHITKHAMHLHVKCFTWLLYQPLATLYSRTGTNVGLPDVATKKSFRLLSRWPPSWYAYALKLPLPEFLLTNYWQLQLSRMSNFVLSPFAVSDYA